MLQNRNARAMFNGEIVGSDPLEFWLAQERHAGLDDIDAPEDRLPSGWWLLPALILAVPAWGGLIWLAFLR